MYLATSMGVGGAEQQARYLARSFRRRGWDVMVVSMVPLEPRRDRRCAPRGSSCTASTCGQGCPDPRGVTRLVRLLREFRPDVLHSLMVHANLLARIVRPITRPPVVVSSVHTPNEGRQWRYLAYRMTNWLTDCTTAVSQDAIDVATRRGAAPRDGIRLIGNGIDLDEYRPDPATRARVRDELGVGDAFTWLAVGRMTGAKAYPDMVSAFADLLRTSYPDARLLIAGSGEPEVEAAVAARIAETGVGDGLSLLGYRSDVADLMRAADGFLLSSAWEGLPMVLLEAASSELPIVATRVGGNEDAVTDGVNGLLVPAGDPAALARGDAHADGEGRRGATRDGPRRPGARTPGLRPGGDHRHVGRPVHRAAGSQACAARHGGTAEPPLSAGPVAGPDQRWTTAQSYGIRSENGSRRSVSDGSCGWVAQLATIADSVIPLKPGPDAGRDHDQRVVVRTQEAFDEGAARRRPVALVVQHELDPAVDARVVQRHLAVPVPALDDVAIDGREVDLAELHEVRVRGAQHVQDGPALVGDAREGHRQDALDGRGLGLIRGGHTVSCGGRTPS